jgi:hypothetical protein
MRSYREWLVVVWRIAISICPAGRSNSSPFYSRISKAHGRAGLGSYGTGIDLVADGGLTQI